MERRRPHRALTRHASPPRPHRRPPPADRYSPLRPCRPLRHRAGCRHHHAEAATRRPARRQLHHMGDRNRLRQSPHASIPRHQGRDLPSLPPDLKHHPTFAVSLKPCHYAVPTKVRGGFHRVRFAGSSRNTRPHAVVCYAARVSTAGPLANPRTPRHSALVRLTHWITVIAFLALLITGAEIVISHPRFYWGEVGNVMTRPLFPLPIPSSRSTVPTGYGFVMPDQNGWSRYLHFEAAWALMLTGLVYAISSLRTGHFRKDLLLARADRTWRAFSAVIGKYLRREPPDPAEARS